MSKLLTTTTPTLRPAKFSDITIIANIFALAFQEEVLFGQIIHPYRHLYPCDMALYALRRERAAYWDWNHRLLVATVSDRCTGGEVVTGWATWERIGEGGLKWWDIRRLMTPVIQLVNRIGSFIWPNRAIHPEYEDLLKRSGPFVEALWSGPRTECWALNSLAVRPDYEGLGHGRALVNWGLEQAEKEGVCASVFSAPGKESFYRNCGFDVQDGRGSQGKGNPMTHVPGGLIFWKYPKGMALD